MTKNSYDFNRSIIFIGMPVYNGEKYIEAAIDSVLNQTFHDFHLAIYDNASTDGTLEIIEKYANKDPRISYIRHPRNLGIAENFWSLASGNLSEYFLWFSCDDLMEPQFIEECIKNLKANPEISMACTEYINFDCDSHININIPIPINFFGKINRYKIYNYLSAAEVLGKANLIHSVFRKQVIADLLATFKFTLHSVWGGDMNLVLAALILSGGCVKSNKKLFLKRLPKGFSINSKRNLLQRYIDKSFPTEFFYEYATTAKKVLDLTGNSRLLTCRLYVRYSLIILIKNAFVIKRNITKYYYQYSDIIKNFFWNIYLKLKEHLRFIAYRIYVNTRELLKLSGYKIHVNTRILLSKIKQFLLTYFK